MTNIYAVALACWRLEKWINNLSTDRKMSAFNSIKRIKEYLENEGIEIIDFTGRRYDVTFPVTVINEDEITDGCVIIEMTKPVIISKDGSGKNGEVYVGKPD